MNANRVERKASIRQAILDYLEQHPHAGDTPQGIVARWLPSPAFDDAAQFIDDVVTEMVTSGELTARALPDGSTLYVRGSQVARPS